MTKTTTCLYHFVVLNWYIFLNYYIPQIGKDEEKLKEFHDGGRSKYLTLLNLHTSIFPFSLAETVLRPHNYPSKKLGLSLLGACNFAYIIRILWRYVQTGNWVYPVFASLSPLGIILFFSASYILSASLYLFGEKINHWKWGATVKPRMKKN
ncbi:similar to 9530008L14Rik protein [Rattus norvegicus]|uniref:Similar to 9530008L14Rik protein n=1 Tax=Rattus norvegicus TaxID=10116 RepID=A6J759_RAT|nr:similar to 9530008L14Rik protein [Rattus norvegicus]